MTKQDWEDMYIMQDAVRNIIETLKKISSNNIHYLQDNTDLLKECSSKLLRISSLVDNLSKGISLTNSVDKE